MLNRLLVEAVALQLNTDPGLVEKDWHVVRALKILAELGTGPARLVFTGGTCLSKAWGLIERFSEDVDFKADVPADYGRPQRRELRRSIETALIGEGFGLVEPTTVRDEGRFFVTKLDYASMYPVLPGLRSHIQVEVSLRTPKLAPIERPVRSFIAAAQNGAHEITSIDAAAPMETAAEKLSALAWRVLSYRAEPAKHDSSMIRHLHDLAALRSEITDEAGFASLVRETVQLDGPRGVQNRPKEVISLMEAMLDELQQSRHWEEDYDTYIQQVTYAAQDRSISFTTALGSVRQIVSVVKSDND